MDCSMCFYRATNPKDLVRHVVKYHQRDPRFRVNCGYPGCGITYNKWTSFIKHVYRSHPDEGEEPLANPDEAELVPLDNDNAHGLLDIDMNEEAVNHEPAQQAVEDAVMSPKELLQWQAGKFLVSIREECKISQSAMQKIITGMDSFMTDFNQFIMEHLTSQADPETELIHVNSLETTEMHPISDLFSPFKTKYRLDKFLEEQCGMVMPQKVSLGTRLVWARKNNALSDLLEKEEFVHIVPFLETLQNLLKNDEIRHCVENPRQRTDGCYKTVLDGSYYRTSNVFSQNINSLGIILYYDELVAGNNLGPNIAATKLAMFYWTLANIYPEYRSKLATVNLLVIVKYSILKAFSLEKILEHCIHDITVLQTDGIKITIGGQDKIFRGSLLFCAGDTPASASIGGFKQSVSANRFCRTCHAKRSTWKDSFRDDNFSVRDIETHIQQVAMVSDDNNLPQMIAFWKRRYGVNEKSCLADIPTFDVTQCLPQDVMHILTEGVVEVHLRVYLKFLIIDMNILTVDDLNHKLTVSTFHLQHFKGDRPAPILVVHLNNGLRQSACQTIVLALNSPFLISECVSNFISENEEHESEIREKQECFGYMLSILNVCLSFDITDCATDYLGRIIETHHLMFDGLYPGNVTPKFHFLIHVPYYIWLFGPPRQHACFRFEALHGYFKSLVPVVKSMKNLPYTLTYLHQALQAARLANVPGTPCSKFLGSDARFSPGVTVLVANLLDANLFDNFIEEQDRAGCKVMRTAEALINGTSYKPHSVILWEITEEDLPVFARIQELFVYQGTLLMSVSLLVSNFHDTYSNAIQCQRR